MWNISGGSERIPGCLGQLSQMMKLRINGVNSYDYLTLQAQDCTPPNLRSLLTFSQTESRLGLVGKLIPGLCLQVTPGGFSFQLCVKMRHSLSDLSLHL